MLIFLLFLALLVGLWPFSFSADNNVRWLNDRNGVAISPVVKGWRPSYAGIIYTTDKINLARRSETGIPEISIELWLKAKATFKRGVGAILSLDDGHDSAAVLFVQWRNSLIIRTRDASDPDGFKEIGMGAALDKNQESFITLVSSPAGIKLFLNGDLKKFYPGLRLIDSGAKALQLIAGVTVDGKSRWRGDIYGLAVYGDTLSAGQVSAHRAFWQSGSYDLLISVGKPLHLYSFDEREGDTIHDHVSDDGNWEIPDNFQILRKNFLSSTRAKLKVTRSLFTDIVINITGFVLLGFFMALHLNRSIRSKWFVILYVFFICSLLSLSIEYLQVYLAQRDSSLLDFLLNSGGGFIGALGILVVEKIKRLQDPGFRSKVQGTRSKEKNFT